MSIYIHYYLFLRKRNPFFHQKLIVSIKQVELRVFSFTKSTRCWKHHRNVWNKSNKSNDKKYTNRTVRRASCKLDVAADQTLLPLPRLPSVSPCQTTHTHTNNYKQLVDLPSPWQKMQQEESMSIPIHLKIRLIHIIIIYIYKLYNIILY